MEYVKKNTHTTGLIIAFITGAIVFFVGLFADVDTPFTLNDKLVNLQTGWTITSNSIMDVM